LVVDGLDQLQEKLLGCDQVPALGIGTGLEGTQLLPRENTDTPAQEASERRPVFRRGARIGTIFMRRSLVVHSGLLAITSGGDLGHPAVELELALLPGDLLADPLLVGEQQIVLGLLLLGQVALFRAGGVQHATHFGDEAATLFTQVFQRCGHLNPVGSGRQEKSPPTAPAAVDGLYVDVSSRDAERFEAA
jgi:hypothetical protein